MKFFFSTLILLPFSVLANTCPNTCNTPGLADSYTLSLAWLPSACKLKQKNYPECIEASSNHKFSLHGLWPDKKECGINYEFCQNVGFHEDRAQYPAVEFSIDNFEELSKVMPNVKYNGHLEKHEWWKHGTCSPFNADKYYQISINLNHQINNSKFVKQYITNNIGNMLNINDLNEAFDDAFGKNASKSLGLVCKEGYLEEIRIHLPTNVEEGLLDISKIIGEIANPNESSCGSGAILLK
jgi:ribonuclease T2